jgi:hypothetical protein
LHPEKVKTLITTVAPTKFDTQQGLLHVWMKGIDADRMVDSFGNMPGDFLNLGFLMLNPARLMIDNKYVGFMEHMDNKPFVENFIRMEKWIFDSPDVPGETFRQFIKDCYQKNLLINSRMTVGGKRVDLKQVTMPLLNFYGRHDHLVPPEACELLTSRVASGDVEDICLDTGHIGIYVSGKCQKEFAPKIANWIRERDTAEKPVRPRARREARFQIHPWRSPRHTRRVLFLLFFNGLEVVYHFFVIVIGGTFKVLAAFAVGIDPLLDQLLTFLGHPGCLIQEGIQHFVILFADRQHGVEGVVECVFVEVQHLFQHLIGIHHNSLLWFEWFALRRRRFRLRFFGACGTFGKGAQLLIGLVHGLL